MTYDRNKIYRTGHIYIYICTYASRRILYGLRLVIVLQRPPSGPSYIIRRDRRCSRTENLWARRNRIIEFELWLLLYVYGPRAIAAYKIARSLIRDGSEGSVQGRIYTFRGPEHSQKWGILDIQTFGYDGLTKMFKQWNQLKLYFKWRKYTYRYTNHELTFVFFRLEILANLPVICRVIYRDDDTSSWEIWHEFTGANLIW